MMRAVTPLLSVGPEDTVSTDRAFEDLLLRAPAVVGTDEDARHVLRRLGLDDELIEDRIHFSHTGEVTVSR